jgi:hypothetical protein
MGIELPLFYNYYNNKNIFIDHGGFGDIWSDLLPALKGGAFGL